MKKAIYIQNLSKTYPGNVLALNNIQLEIYEGEFFGLLGPNGAGKSTTIEIVCGLTNKTSGQVNVFGHDIIKNSFAAKRCIGLVPQEFNFNVFEKSIDILISQAGYYGIPFKEAKNRAEYFLKRLGIWEKRHAQVRALSGGMKRRLMIARGLIHEPKLLILDEPTAGVDIELRRMMWEFLQEINKQRGTTIILTTHYLEEAEYLCKNIAIIDKGEIIERGDKKTLISKLTQQTVILDLANSLTEIPIIQLEGVKLKLLDSTSLEVSYEKELALNEIFTWLNSNNIMIQSMRNKTNRLEELFLYLTRDKT